MKVQRAILPETNRVTWLVLGDNFLPIQPIQSFLTYFQNIERSPFTIRSYAFHLKLYWQFLESTKLDWKKVGLKELSDFVVWLREPHPSGIVAIHERTAKRTESTVNTMLASISAFYTYQERLGVIEPISLHGTLPSHQVGHRGFLHGIAKSKPAKTRLLKLKATKRIPRTLTPDQLGQLVGACGHLRDKFLLCLLSETGMRIGQALGLRHEDILSREKIIRVIPRDDNANGARAKTRESNSIHVSVNLMRLYADYLVDEVQGVRSDYVFINLWHEPTGQPLTTSSVADIFRRLEKKTGIHITPHMLRHTHATELIRSGWDAALVQKRLGHASVQTTLNFYTHLTDQDLKQAFVDHLKKKEMKP
ncbi:MAG TPA: tyrosine-type recombinase/integrase [Acidobacteriota bacterium]|nr:tyrosine-type recombinase/integrase [Acidobacteriota bacterium]HNH82940.1 tyrosine-type recombinase/integrase [Acidobacteriota bacterium]HNJ43252.1 tyrosine-type recombinase/integrase [Acidobacteriota bacterium]